MQNEQEDFFALDLQISEEETFFLGMIVAHWGALEHEIFIQALKSFDVEEKEQGAALPKSFNNIQFTETLRVWKDRVLSKLVGDRLATSTKAYEEILQLKGPRDALTHGMLHWSPEDPHAVSTVRAKKREIITTRFSTDDLRDMAFRLAKLNFRLRYPGGVKDLAAERTASGLHLSRKGFEMFFGNTDDTAPEKDPADASD